MCSIDYVICLDVKRLVKLIGSISSLLVCEFPFNHNQNVISIQSPAVNSYPEISLQNPSMEIQSQSKSVRDITLQNQQGVVETKSTVVTSDVIKLSISPVLALIRFGISSRLLRSSNPFPIQVHSYPSGRYLSSRILQFLKRNFQSTY